jgi:hypothetical protein
VVVVRTGAPGALRPVDLAGGAAGEVGGGGAAGVDAGAPDGGPAVGGAGGVVGRRPWGRGGGGGRTGLGGGRGSRRRSRGSRRRSRGSRRRSRRGRRRSRRDRSRRCGRRAGSGRRRGGGLGRSRGCPPLGRFGRLLRFGAGRMLAASQLRHSCRRGGDGSGYRGRRRRDRPRCRLLLGHRSGRRLLRRGVRRRRSGTAVGVIAEADYLLDPLDDGRAALRFGLGFGLGLGRRLLGLDLLALPFQKAGARTAERVGIVIFKTTLTADDHSSRSLPDPAPILSDLDRGLFDPRHPAPWGRH